MKPVNYDKVQEVTQEIDENLAVFLSQVTEAFRKDTNTDHESAEGRLLWPGMLSASSFLIFRIDLQNLEAGPHPPCRG